MTDVNFSQLLKSLTVNEIEQIKNDLIDIINQLENVNNGISQFPDYFDKNISEKISQTNKLIDDLNEVINKQSEKENEYFDGIRKIKKQIVISNSIRHITMFLAAFLGTLSAMFVVIKILEL